MRYQASTQISVNYYPLESYQGKASYEVADDGEVNTYHYVINKAESLEEVIENAIHFYLRHERTSLLYVGYRPSIDDEDDYARVEVCYLSDENGDPIAEELLDLLKKGETKGWIAQIEFEVFCDGTQLVASDYKAKGILNIND